MLRWRVPLGIGIIAALAGLVWLDHTLADRQPGLILFPIILAVGFLAAGEMLTLCTVRGQRPRKLQVLAGSLAVLAAAAVPHVAGLETALAECPLGILGWPMMAFVFLLVAGFVAEIIAYQEPQGVIRNLAISMFCVAVAGLLLSFLAQLRFVIDADRGLVVLIALLMTVKFGDTGAYTVGRLLGRHKLAPRVSPGKTIEGLLGGLVFSVLGAWLGLGFFGPLIVPDAGQLEFWRVAFFGVVCGLAGVVGDLAVSILKRDAGRKDSSGWLPGFGGVLDMIDSLLAAAPVAYLLAIARVIGV